METLIRAVQQGDSELIREISQSFLNNVDQLTEVSHSNAKHKLANDHVST